MTEPMGTFREMAPGDLKPHPMNPRTHAEEEAVLRESIQENGFYGAVIVQESTSMILAGHDRYAHLVAAGADVIPCWVVDVDDERALKILLVDNRTADLARRDTPKLLKLLEPMGSQVDGTGYSLADLEQMHDLLEAPDLDWVENVKPVPESDYWPRLKFRAPPEVVARFNRALEETGRETTHGALRALLRRYVS